MKSRLEAGHAICAPRKEPKRSLVAGRKASVAAVLGRGGTVRAEERNSRKEAAIHELVRGNVIPGPNLYTDALKSYEGLDEVQHQVVDHAIEYY